MRIGIMFGNPNTSFDGLVEAGKRAESRGLDTLWLPNIFGLDAITAAAVIGREVPRIEFGTAVVPTYPRHPTAIAQQALTAAVATGGRFTLGIGLSHKVVIEGLLGMSYATPARHMREYLEVLTPLLRGEPAKFEGEEYRVKLDLEVPGGAPVSLLVAALGPVMLGLAGRLADGTITWMTGPKTLDSHIVPTLSAAAERAGRPAPRVVAGLPVALTNDESAGREAMSKLFAVYGTLPSYRAMLDREGAANPAAVALVGDETSLRKQVEHLSEIGVTDLDAAVTPVEEGCKDRTMEFLASLS